MRDLPGHFVSSKSKPREAESTNFSGNEENVSKIHTRCQGHARLIIIFYDIAARIEIHVNRYTIVICQLRGLKATYELFQFCYIRLASFLLQF